MKSIMPYISPGMKDRCIVCGAFAANYFASVGGRIYRRCDACQATFLDRDHAAAGRPQRLDQYRLLPGDGYEDDPDWFNAFARERIGGAFMQGAPYQTKPRTTGRNRFLLTSTLNV
jgi:hypothetical protein